MDLSAGQGDKKKKNSRSDTHTKGYHKNCSDFNISLDGLEW